MTAFIAIASAPQNVILTTAFLIDALPARAERPPRRPKQINDAIDTITGICFTGSCDATMSGTAAPRANMLADAIIAV